MAEPTREVQKGVQPQADFMFIRGMDSFTDPTFVAARQYRAGFNVVNRGGTVQCRPGYRSLLALPTGRVQGLKLFTPTGGRPHLVAAVDGRVFASRAPFTSFSRIPNIRFRKGVRNVYFADCQKAVNRNPIDGTLTVIDPYRVLVMQDGGYTRAAFWDGSNSGHLDPTEAGARQTPSGGVMKWSGDRLWVARGPQLFASDIADPLSFDENVYLAEGQPLLFPYDITALAEIPSATNPFLFVCTAQDGHVVQSAIRDRSKWKSTDDFQCRISPAGCVGHRAITNQYGLIWWYSPGGLMSLDSGASMNVSSQLHYKDIEMAISKANLSKNVSRIAMSSVENFLLVSVPSGNSYNRHTWVLDQSAGDLSTSDSPPAWAGIWTGTRPVEWASDVVEGQLRTFFISHDSDGQNRIWEAFQARQLDDDQRIEWKFISKAHAGDGVNPAEFRFAEVYLSQLRGAVQLAIDYAGPYRGQWKPLLDRELLATGGGISASQRGNVYIPEVPAVPGDPGTPAVPAIPATTGRSLRSQSRTIRTPEASGARGQVTSEGDTSENIDFSHQIRITGTGPGGVRGYKIYSKPFPQSATGGGIQNPDDGSSAMDVLGGLLREFQSDTDMIRHVAATPGGGFFTNPMELRAEDSDYICNSRLYGGDWVEQSWSNSPVTLTCPDGLVGTPITVSAGVYSSTVSQADADAQALADAQSRLVCVSLPPVEILNRPEEIIEGSDGNFYISSTFAGQIWMVPPEGGVRYLLASGLGVARSLIEATDGNLYVCSRDVGIVYRITKSGEVSELATGLSSAQGLVQGADGDLYVSSTEGGGTPGYVWRITLGGDKTIFATGTSDGLSILRGSAGEFYVIQYTSGYYSGNLYKVSPTGTVSVLTSGVRQGLFVPQTMVQATDGNIYLVDSAQSTFWKIAPDGTKTAVPNSGMSGYDHAIIQGRDSYLYYITGSNTLRRYPLGGGASELVCLALGDGMVHGSDGNIYLCARSQNAVWKITPAGVRTQFV